MNTGPSTDMTFLNALSQGTLSQDSGKTSLRQKRTLEADLPLFSTALDNLHDQQAEPDVLDIHSSALPTRAAPLSNGEKMYAIQPGTTNIVSHLQGSGEVALALWLNTPASQPMTALTGIPVSVSDPVQGGVDMELPGLADITQRLIKPLQRYPATHLALTRSEQGYTVWIRDFTGQLGSDLDTVVDMITRFLQDNEYPLAAIMLNGQQYALPQHTTPTNRQGSRE